MGCLAYMDKPVVRQNFLIFTRDWKCWHFLPIWPTVLYHLGLLAHGSVRLALCQFLFSDHPGGLQGAPYGGYQNKTDFTCQVKGHGSPKGTGTRVSDYYHACNLPLFIINQKENPRAAGIWGPWVAIFIFYFFVFFAKIWKSFYLIIVNLCP